MSADQSKRKYVGEAICVSLAQQTLFAHSNTLWGGGTLCFRLAQNEILHLRPSACIGFELRANRHDCVGGGGALWRCLFERGTIVALFTRSDVVAIAGGSSKRISGTLTT